MKPVCLSYMIDEATENLLKEFFGDGHLRLPDGDEGLVTVEHPDARVVITGPDFSGPSAIEVAQALRLNYPGAFTCMVTRKAVPYNKRDLIKNGFTDIFYLPLEEELLRIKLARTKTESPVCDRLEAVKVFDLASVKDLEINTYVYLPANGRYVPFNVSGTPLDEEKLRKLSDREITNIYVAEDDLPEFYKAFARTITNTQNSKALSETEKKQRLRKIVRDLLADLFTESSQGLSSGPQFSKACHEIVHSYLGEALVVNRWIERLRSVSGENGDFFTRSANAMIASVLIAIGLHLDKKTIENLAVGALLSNIGQSQLPEYMTKKKREDFTDEEKEIFSKHPIHACDLLKLRKIVLPEQSQQIILQHMERFDGKGFPNELRGPQIIREAQILHLSHSILELSSTSAGKKSISFVEAFESFQILGQNDPSHNPIDPKLLNEIEEIIQNGPIEEEKKQKAYPGRRIS